VCHPQEGQGWNHSRPPYQGGNNYNSSFSSNFNSNQPSLKDLVLGRAKINESLNKKLAVNEKTLESINIKIETLSSGLKNQLSFNKMIETQLA
jgi:K+-transporting ATPase c subunit